MTGDCTAEERKGCSEDEKESASSRQRRRGRGRGAWEHLERRYASITEKEVEEWLEWLRQTNRKFPVIVQIVANWSAATLVFLYYSWAYYRAQRENRRTGMMGRLPLMTEAASSSSTAVDEKEDEGSSASLLRETHAKLRELLTQQGLLSSEPPSSPHRFLPPSPLRTPAPDRHRTERGSDMQHRMLVVDKEEWVQEIRSNSNLRRLVSRFMQHEDRSRQLDPSLFDVLDSMYEQLIPLPPTAPPQYRQGKNKRGGDKDRNEGYLYELSAIVPCHDAEPIELVRRTIQTLWRHCRHPDRVQIVLVHAVDISSPPRLDVKSLLEEVRETNRLDPKRHWWGDAKCVTYRGGGGRGPALNLGAVCSQGQVLVFVHSDCQLPRNWDTKISSRILMDPTVSATSFLLGVDCSRTSWIKSLFFGFTDDEDAVANQYPWGILAVQIMVNLRTYFLRMPYGDQAIAMRSTYFGYIGGFPNQPIMEDFDFMSYLRRRTNYLENGERYSLIGAICWSSARRWQRVGVLYVTIGNAILVHRYTRETNRWTPQRVFEYYYNKRPQQTPSANGGDDAFPGSSGKLD